MSPANIYYHLTRLGIKKEKDKYKNPNIYSGKDLDILCQRLEKINEHKLNRENVDYWKNKSRKLGNENKKTKKNCKVVNEYKK